MKCPFLIGFLVPVLTVSASAQTLASLPLSRALPFVGVPQRLPGPLYRLPLTPALLPPAFFIQGPSLEVPTLAPVRAISRLPIVRMTADKELPAVVRRQPPLILGPAAKLDEKEEADRAPALDDMFDGRNELNPRQEQRFELPEAELEREIGVSAG